MNLLKKLYLSFWLSAMNSLASYGNCSPADQLFVASLKADKTFWKWQSSVGSKQVHYLEKGTGNNHVILLHGLGANTFTWHHQIELLASSGFHVWALDFLGFGFSEKPTEINYNLKLFQSQVLDFMKAMGIERAHIVGHSMGGAISLAIAIDSKEQLRSLVLIAPAAYPVNLPLPILLGKHLGKMLVPFVNEKLVRLSLNEIFHDRSRITKEQLEAYGLPLKMEGGREAALQVLKAFDKQMLKEMSAHYNQIQVPVFIVWGENDKRIPSSHLELFLQDIPHADQLLLKACGHAPQEEQPEIFNPRFVEFLARQ